MSEVFQEYASFYDLFYGEKDYAAESRYVLDLVRAHSSHPVQTLLDLGCGTGTHALSWRKQGISVTGVEGSERMLAQAREKVADAGGGVELIQSDIRTLDLKRRFDVVTAMFAVVGYLTSNEDVEAGLRTARRHLAPGRLFIFDVWYGPAVLAQQPQVRELVVPSDSNGVVVTRHARPEMNVLEHRVTVHYTVRRRIGVEIREAHAMRYFFPKELEYMLSKVGFKMIALTRFLSVTEAPREEDWNVAVVARAEEHGAR